MKAMCMTIVNIPHTEIHRFTMEDLESFLNLKSRG